MKVSRTRTLSPGVARFAILSLAAVMALPTAWPSQTAKALIGDACYNELQQREMRTLWSYIAERHSNNHVFREQVIETVDAPVHHLLAVDGQPPTSEQKKEENDRLHALLSNASRRRALQKRQDSDEKTMEELLRIVPEAFVFDDQGPEGQSERIAFHPNPEFTPKAYEQRILHALDGVVFIDLHDKRIARISGSLGTPVEFGWGVIGHVEQGGTTEITRVQLSPGIWKTSAEKIDIDGRFVILKTINKHQDESGTTFEPVAPDTTFAQALKEIEKKQACNGCGAAKDPYSAKPN